MKTSSAAQPLSPKAARNCVLINQLATPGLGSLMAGRYVAGTGQILLALIGFGLVVAWFVGLLNQMYQQFNGDASPKSVAGLGEAGALSFAAAWLWSLITSFSLLREARANEAYPKPAT